MVSFPVPWDQELTYCGSVALDFLFLLGGKLAANALHIVQMINMQPHQHQKEERLKPQALSIL